MDASQDVSFVLYISRFLSFTLILLSFFLKLPQIQKVYNAGSSKGISVRGYWLELYSYLVSVGYSYAYQLHYTTYMELILLAIQSSIILSLAIVYTNQFQLENGVLLTIITMFMGVTVLKLVPIAVMDFLLLCTIFMSMASKGLQIHALYEQGSAGDVSVITWGLSAYGCAARVFTSIVEVGALLVIGGYVISMILNIIVVIQCLYYGPAKKRE